MRMFVSRGYKGQVYPILGTLGAREQFELNREMFGKFMFGLFVALWTSPALFLTIFFFFIYRYRVEFHNLFFRNRAVKAKYKDMLMPMVSPKLFSAVGYRVYPEELDEHLQLINSEYKEDIMELVKKGERMKRDMSRQYGFSIDKLCRHVFYIGTTGAGKSETIMAFFTDVVRNGGGIGFIDGKADITMEGRIYNLCKEEYYETQFNVINFTSPEESPDTNTYSPLLSYTSAMKASEFLGEYIGGGGGSNGDYFANRSKVMMGNLIQHFKNRQYYYQENFSFSDVSQGRDHVEMTNIFSLSYGVCLEIEEIIKERLKVSTKFKAFMNKARGLKVPKLDEIENLEQLHEYLNQNSTVIYLIEKELGMSFDFISNYFILYSHIGEYIQGISPSWHKYTIALSKALYAVMKHENKHYLHLHSNPVKMRDLRNAYVQFKRKERAYEIAFEALKQQKEIQKNFNEAVGHDPKAKESLEQLESNAIIQHQYAMQGWDRVFDLFKAYQKIMGVVYPEVDGEDIIKNGKVLFVMLPATELSEDLVGALGKLIILLFKNIASIALGGTKQSATSVQFKIYQHRIKPSPVYLMVTDEIGSYMPSKGLSLIASQVRSLQIALIISGQDTVSIEPDGSDGKREKSRLMANLAKIILQTRDMDTAELERLIPEVEVIETDNFIRSAVSHDVITTETASVKKVKMFDIGVATKFVKGFGVYLDGAREEPVYFQSYYLGDNIKQALQIRKHNAFVNIYKEYELEAA